ncbi:MAG: hypothetical protein K9N06_03510 [Candidatus Cloacimonetes bacterium]|nr:hypothetical protein [Candidatus Cloacimonadota bacterium]
MRKWLVLLIYLILLNSILLSQTVSRQALELSEGWHLFPLNVEPDENIEAYDAALILLYNLGMITQFPVN